MESLKEECHCLLESWGFIITYDTGNGVIYTKNLENRDRWEVEINWHGYGRFVIRLSSSFYRKIIEEGFDSAAELEKTLLLYSVLMS